MNIITRFFHLYKKVKGDCLQSITLQQASLGVQHFRPEELSTDVECRTLDLLLN